MSLRPALMADMSGVVPVRSAVFNKLEICFDDSSPRAIKLNSTIKLSKKPSLATL